MTAETSTRSVGDLPPESLTRLPAQPLDRAAEADGGDHVSVPVAHGSADRGDAGLAFLDALGDVVALQTHRAGRAAVERQQARLPARSSAGRASTAATPRSAGRRPRRRTAARSRRLRRAAASRSGGRARPAGTRPRRLARADQLEAEAEAALRIAAHQTVLLERDGQAVGRRPRQAGLRPAARPGRAGPPARAPQDEHPFVDAPDAAYTVHIRECYLRKWDATCLTQHAGPETLAEKVWDRHVVHSRARRTRPAVHRPAPRPRGHQPAGVRRAAAQRPHGPPARPHRRHRGPQRPDRRHRPADRRPDLGPPGRGAAREHRRVRHHQLPDGRPGPGHRPRHRPRAGPHAARHDHRVRRQPHRHPRRVRRARVRHRHQRGRARAGHPDAAADAGRSGWRDGRGRAARRRHRQGRHPRHHRRTSAPAAASATSSSTAARPSARCRWRAG